MASDSLVPSQALVPALRTSDLALLDDTLLDADEIASTLRYGAASKAQNTLRSYASDWRSFLGWVERKGIEPLPCSPGLSVVRVSQCVRR